MLQATCQSVGPILTQLYPCAQPGRNDSSLAPGPGDSWIQVGRNVHFSIILSLASPAHSTDQTHPGDRRMGLSNPPGNCMWALCPFYLLAMIAKEPKNVQKGPPLGHMNPAWK